MKKKKIIIIGVILLIILMIYLLSFVLLKSRTRAPYENFKYIYSDEMDEGTFSPEMIHIVIALYEGNINPKAITKASYNLITQIIPTYLRICKDDKSIQEYYENNSKQISLEIGITKEEDFKKFVDEIKKLSGNLKFEYAKFDRETIEINKNNLEVVLKIKYKEQEEISFNVRINNKETSSKSAIEFFKK